MFRSVTRTSPAFPPVMRFQNSCVPPMSRISLWPSILFSSDMKNAKRSRRIRVAAEPAALLSARDLIIERPAAAAGGRGACVIPFVRGLSGTGIRRCSRLSGRAKKLTRQRFRRGVCPIFSRGDLCRESPRGDIPLTLPLTGTDNTCSAAFAGSAVSYFS